MACAEGQARDWYARWKSVANDPDPRPWTTPEQLSGYFQRFRPHGRGTERVFEGVADGASILERLRTVYAATAPGYGDGGTSDVYFVARHPSPLAAADARAWARTHAESMAAIARAVGREDLASSLERMRTVDVVMGSAPPSTDDSLDTDISEACCDFVVTNALPNHPAWLLDDAFYTIACESLLAYHLLWPAIGPASYADGQRHVRAPVLWVAGRFDKLANEEAILATVATMTSPDVTALVVDHGHVDVVLGDAAPRDVWAPVAAWLAGH